jgi:hypothetical protein
MQMQEFSLIIIVYCGWLPSFRFPDSRILDEFPSALFAYPAGAHGRRNLGWQHGSSWLTAARSA